MNFSGCNQDILRIWTISGLTALCSPHTPPPMGRPGNGDTSRVGRGGSSIQEICISQLAQIKARLQEHNTTTWAGGKRGQRWEEPIVTEKQPSRLPRWRWADMWEDWLTGCRASRGSRITILGARGGRHSGQRHLLPSNSQGCWRPRHTVVNQNT